MDGVATTTTAPGTGNNLDARLLQLVQDMEAEGYRIGMTREDDSCWIKMSDRPTPEFCAKMKLNVALREDPELEAAFLPFMRRHRPFFIWQE